MFGSYEAHVAEVEVAKDGDGLMRRCCLIHLKNSSTCHRHRYRAQMVGAGKANWLVSVRVRRVVCAVDCGTVVNPDTVQAQIQSGIIFGATAALYGKITLKDGRVEQTNFDTYQMLRMNDAPAIEVHIVRSAEPPGGMGETGTSAIVPAIANAIFAATGKRLRKMPIDVAALKEPT